MVARRATEDHHAGGPVHLYADGLFALRAHQPGTGMVLPLIRHPFRINTIAPAHLDSVGFQRTNRRSASFVAGESEGLDDFQIDRIGATREEIDGRSSAAPKRPDTAAWPTMLRPPVGCHELAPILRDFRAALLLHESTTPPLGSSRSTTRISSSETRDDWESCQNAVGQGGCGVIPL